ncbi:MAG: hypothetical protein MUO54_14650, partial [Anaerolineales bacterium]|nr:hypothetical protein [Anaerolineales bacterium]
MACFEECKLIGKGVLLASIDPKFRNIAIVNIEAINIRLKAITIVRAVEFFFRKLTNLLIIRWLTFYYLG